MPEGTVARARRIAQRDSSAAVLIMGEKGAGQELVALDIARALLCPSAHEGQACGDCAVCRALDRDACPDLLMVKPRSAGDQIVMGQIVPTKEPESSSDEGRVPCVREFLQNRPLVARRKVVIVGRAHRLNPAASNALLRLMEETPEHARLVLWTDAAARLLPTVRSRCLLVPCELPPLGEGADRFAWRLAGGAPQTVAALERAPQFVEAMRAFIEWLPSARREDALKASDDFQSMADALVEPGLARETPARSRHAALLQLLGNALCAELEDGNLFWRGLLEDALEGHRLVQGMVRFDFVCDRMFTRNLPLCGG
ncbi:MAG: hypothetical protein AB1725_07980 [Armatimonadota bacterium]